MVFKKSLLGQLGQLANVTKSATLSIKNCRISSSSTPRLPTSRFSHPSQNRKGSNVRRFLHRGAVYQPDVRTSPFGCVWMGKLNMKDSLKERLDLEEVRSPDLGLDETRQDPFEEMSDEIVRKFMKCTQLAQVKTRLELVNESWITYERFVDICSEDCGKEEGLRTAKILDESGVAIVLGNKVFLHPQQVVKTIQALIPVPTAVRPNDPLKKELEELEKEKAVIDKKAEALVRSELWFGLGFLGVQTAGFMRLTFWELSWDVMEPICFFVTSLYFMAGYTFFLRTSKEPSFEGFFQSRLNSKQKKLMKSHNFDNRRYNELKKAFSPHHVPSFNPLHFDPLHLNQGGSDVYAYQ